MKKNNYFFSLLVLSVVFVSGCIDLGGIFGSNVINVQQTTIPNSERDPLIIKSATTLPTGLVLPDQDVKLITILQNKDNLKIAHNVFVDLFNPSIFKCIYPDGSFAGGRPCVTEDIKFSRANWNNLLPGEESQVIFNLKSPSENEIAGIKQTTTLDYKASYDFESSLSYVVPVVDVQEIISRQQANEKTTVQISKSHSTGPVQIDAELQGAQYILDGQKAVMLFKIKNVGSGTLKDSVIENTIGLEERGASEFWGDIVKKVIGFLAAAGSQESTTNEQRIIKGFIIKFPDDFQLVNWPGKDTKDPLFACDTTTKVCTNVKPIPIFKDESRVSMRFEVLSSLPDGTPFRSYSIVAVTGYTYELRNSISITVNPFQNV